MSETPKEDMTPEEHQDILVDQPVGSVPDPYQGDDYDSDQQDYQTVEDEDEDAVDPVRAAREAGDG